MTNGELFCIVAPQALEEKTAATTECSTLKCRASCSEKTVLRGLTKTGAWKISLTASVIYSVNFSQGVMKVVIIIITHYAEHSTKHTISGSSVIIFLTPHSLNLQQFLKYLIAT